jgi:hypothetical protein
MSHAAPQQPQAQQAQSVFPKSHVGFDSITTQIEKKLLKRGFQFNVICVGKSFRKFEAMPFRGQHTARAGQSVEIMDAPHSWSCYKSILKIDQLYHPLLQDQRALHPEGNIASTHTAAH